LSGVSSARGVKIGKTRATVGRFEKIGVIWRKVLQKRRESGYTEEAFFPRRRFAKSPPASSAAETNEQRSRNRNF